jgi:predicted transcriptional regulator
MTLKYSIAVLNNDIDYILKPFLSDIPKVDKLIIITSKITDYNNLRNRINLFLDMIGVKVDYVYVGDITNFFQIFLTMRSICIKYGEPEWVNISCGSGIGMAALAVHAVNRNMKMVAYEKDTDKSFIINVKKLQKINVFDPRYYNLIHSIGEGVDTIKKLSELYLINKSTVSRRLNNLMLMEIITRTGKGKNGDVYIFTLSDFGKTLLITNK